MHQYVNCTMRDVVDNKRNVHTGSGLCEDVQEITIDVLSWDVSTEEGGSIGKSWC